MAQSRCVVHHLQHEIKALLLHPNVERLAHALNHDAQILIGQSEVHHDRPRCSISNNSCSLKEIFRSSLNVFYAHGLREVKSQHAQQLPRRVEYSSKALQARSSRMAMMEQPRRCKRGLQLPSQWCWHPYGHGNNALSLPKCVLCARGCSKADSRPDACCLRARSFI